jgi:hypothetical protein
MAAGEMQRKWEIGHDRFGRRVILTWNAPCDWTIEIQPLNQRDDGEIIRSLSAELLIEAGRIAAEFKR